MYAVSIQAALNSPRARQVSSDLQFDVSDMTSQRIAYNRNGAAGRVCEWQNKIVFIETEWLILERVGCNISSIRHLLRVSSRLLGFTLLRHE